MPVPPPYDIDTITRVRPATVLDHGRPVPDWDSPPAEPDLAIDGCSVQPGASAEVIANRQNVTIRWTVFAPYDADVAETDGVRWQGQLYQVDGRPERWPDPDGVLDHSEIYLIEMEG